MAGFAVYLGASVLAALGGAVARWPAAAARLLTTDDDGNRLAPTPADVRRARLAGLALILFAASLAWYGPAAFQGAADAGAP